VPGELGGLARVPDGASQTGALAGLLRWRGVSGSNQDGWVPYGAEGLEAGLRALDLDQPAIAAAMRNADIEARIRRDFAGGVRSGVNGTPSFYVNGHLHQGDFASLAHTIDGLIARRN
jgi:protein-disulfide isomerase